MCSKYTRVYVHVTLLIGDLPQATLSIVSATMMTTVFIREGAVTDGALDTSATHVPFSELEVSQSHDSYPIIYNALF